MSDPLHVSPARVELGRDGDTLTITGGGAWTAFGVEAIDADLREAVKGHTGPIHFDTGHVEAMDTAGAWLVERTRQSLNGQKFVHLDDDPNRLKLVRVLRPDAKTLPEQVTEQAQLSLLARLGKATSSAWADLIMAMNLIGAAIAGAQMKRGQKGGIRPISIIHQMDHMGLKAVPVISVMSFLIGMIIAQQGAYQLKFYGEELLTVSLVGILHLREIAVLLTAVMVAGRTGSAITAEIGTMKMREEIDALHVMGLNAVGVLILPRLVALLIVMPILVLISGITGIAGAIFVSDLYVGITPSQFLDALLTNVGPEFIIGGLIKAPFMAAVIGVISAVEGMKVGGSSESLGRHTTSAVVRSIFAVILMDGLFAIFFAAIGY
ncbi:MAG: ABC transporter permease [Pseudomonadota bacterium]